MIKDWKWIPKDAIRQIVDAADLATYGRAWGFSIASERRAVECALDGLDTEWSAAVREVARILEVIK